MAYSLRTRTPVSVSKDVTSPIKKQTKKPASSKKPLKNSKRTNSLSNSSSENSLDDTPVAPKQKKAKVPKQDDSYKKLSLYHLAKRQLDRGTQTKTENLSEVSETSSEGLISSRMCGRDDERSILSSFWENHVEARLPGSLYISGQPGTGKTALIKEWVAEKQPSVKKRKSANKDSLHVIHFNCVSVSGPRGFIPAILESLSFDHSVSELEPFEYLKSLVLGRKHGFFFIVLDELDHLLSQTGGGLGQEILYQLFELVHSSGSQLALVGIANDLNLTDRFLPRLRARGFEPERLKFMPYGVEQIKAILEKLLLPINNEAARRYTEANLSIQTVFHPGALEFCSRKVAGCSGDLRRALDLCRQALGLAETASTDPTKSFTDPIIPIQVCIVHILEAEKASAGSPTFKKISSLSVQAQVILVAVLNLVSQSKSLQANTVYDQYYKLCEGSDLLQALSRSEFGDLLVLLDSLGLLGSSHGTPAPRGTSKGGLSRPLPPLTLLVPEEELRKALTKMEVVRPLIS